MIFLFQEADIIQQAASLKDYGVLGIFSIMMIAIIIFMGRHFFLKHKRNENRIVELEKRLESYLVNDQKILLDAVNECKNEIQNSNALKEKSNALNEKLLIAITKNS